MDQLFHTVHNAQGLGTIFEVDAGQVAVAWKPSRWNPGIRRIMAFDGRMLWQITRNIF